MSLTRLGERFSNERARLNIRSKNIEDCFETLTIKFVTLSSKLSTRRPSARKTKIDTVSVYNQWHFKFHRQKRRKIFQGHLFAAGVCSETVQKKDLPDYLPLQNIPEISLQEFTLALALQRPLNTIYLSIYYKRRFIRNSCFY